jgi:glycerophosphoryl diester phosphodiesterase
MREDDVLERRAMGSGKVLVIGHRGALGLAPENTLAGFRKGLECGADLLELDVHLTADGELAVIHDSDVSRTTDGHGRVRQMTLAQLRALDAGSWFDPSFRGERIPSLPEVLDWARGRIPLVVEIKGDPEPAPDIEARLVETLRAHAMLDEVIVISFHHPSVRRVKEIAPDVATGILYQARLVDAVGAARAARADAIRPSWSYVSRELVEEAHVAGLCASTWNANDDERAAYLVDLGVDSIGSDYPDRLRRYVDRVGRKW